MQSDYKELFIDIKIRILKFVDHWVGLPLCILLGMVENLRYPFSPITLNVPTKKYPKSILVIKFFGLGSIILASPLLRDIKNKYPESKIIFLTFKNNLDLLKHLGIVEDIRIVNTDNPIILLYSIFSNLIYFSFHKPDISIDLEFYSKFSTIMSYLSGAKWRLGFYIAQFWRKSLINVPIHFNYARHILEIYGMFGKTIGVEGKNLIPLRIEVTQEEKDFIGRYFLQIKIKENNILLGVNVNASDLAFCRRWPRENFVRVTITLLKEYKDLKVFLTGDKNEKVYTDYVFDILEKDIKERVFNLAGQLHFGEFVALLDKLDLFLTNDNGAFHIAKAQGIPTVSIWGPGSPELYGPYTEEKNRHAVIYKRWPCSPCLYIYRTDAGYFCRKVAPCLKRIDSQEVTQTIRDLINSYVKK